MEEKVRVELGSLQLEDIIAERINQLIKEKKPEIVANAILENLGYEEETREGHWHIYVKETKYFMIIIKCYLCGNPTDGRVIPIDYRIPVDKEGINSYVVNLKELNNCIEMAENDIEEFKREYGKNI